MKVAITKIGANITFSSSNKSAANADILYALRTLGTKGNEITIVTHKTRNTVLPKQLKFQEIQGTKTFDDFDCVLVFNGSINFFGGAEDPNLLALYKALHHTSKRIFWIQTDGAMYMQKLQPLIWKRPWYDASQDYSIDEGQIVYLTQGRDIDKMRNAVLSKKNAYNPDLIVHYPWEKTILSNWEKKIKVTNPPFSQREFTFGFGGATRNAYKKKKIETWYNKPNTLLFGNLRGVVAPFAHMESKVSYQQMIPMMERCKATVIFGDELYNNNFRTLREYESILAGCLVLFDKEFNTDSPYAITPKDTIMITEELAQNQRREVLESYNTLEMRTVLNEMLEQLI